MVSSYVDPAFDIFIATLGFSFFFLVFRIVTIRDWWNLLTSKEVVATGFQIGKSWGSNLAIFNSFMGVALPLVSGTMTQKDLQAMNFFYALLFTWALALYLACQRIAWFLVADFFVLWSFLGSTSTLWYAIHVIGWFPSYASWLLVVLLPLGMILLTFYSWSEMKIMIDQLKTELHTKHTHSEFQLTAKWMMR